MSNCKNDRSELENKLSGPEFIKAHVMGALSVLWGCSSFYTLSAYQNTKKAIFEDLLNKAPEMTEQIYQASYESAGKIAAGLETGEQWWLITATMAGVAGIHAIYTVCDGLSNSRPDF